MLGLDILVVPDQMMPPKRSAGRMYPTRKRGRPAKFRQSEVAEGVDVFPASGPAGPWEVPDQLEQSEEDEDISLGSQPPHGRTASCISNINTQGAGRGLTPSATGLSGVGPAGWKRPRPSHSH